MARWAGLGRAATSRGLPTHNDFVGLWTGDERPDAVERALSEDEGADFVVELSIR
ncbi:hypothetical protein [Archangium sp.]|uniref:hypothetical protein n=1 Tax=Archangium sp. TaxID=1872627 RepID=UPI002D28CE05|nr:hypothetical protein [Archangium sp.]HYO52126.1 hypothetical protein [Archangium sp.]